MAANTEISWCDATFNPWIGCTKVSPGCDNCYAARQDKFRSWTPEGWGGPRKRTGADTWGKPSKWNDQPFAECMGCGWRGESRNAELRVAEGMHPPCDALHCPSCAKPLLKEARRRVFCASLADVFDNQVDPNWRADLFELISLTRNIDWLLLTKRIGNARDMMYDALGAPVVLPNVWLGATIVNQEEADRDIPKLLAVPARVRFLSMEPLLGPVDLTKPRAFGLHGFGQWAAAVDWIIVGGESGPGARPMHPDWARALRDQCASAGVPLHFKQWGEFHPSDQHDQNEHGCRGTPTALRSDGSIEHRPLEASAEIFTRKAQGMCRIGKKRAGRLLDGVTHDAFPEAA